MAFVSVFQSLSLVPCSSYLVLFEEVELFRLMHQELSVHYPHTGAMSESFQPSAVPLFKIYLISNTIHHSQIKPTVSIIWRAICYCLRSASTAPVWSPA